MTLASFRRASNDLLQWIAGLLRPTVLNLRCTCSRGDKCLNLLGQLIGSADETQITFSVRWPTPVFRPSRFVRVQLAAFRGRDTKRLAPAAVPSQPAIEPSLAVAENEWEITQSRAGRMTHVQVRLRMRTVADCEAIELEIRDLQRGRLLGRSRFEAIDEARAQRLRIDSLKAEAPQLWVRSGDDRWHQGEFAGPTSDCVVAQFTLREPELSQLLPACQTSLSWALHAEARRTVLKRKTLGLGNGPICVRSDPISVADRNLFPAPCLYRLVANVVDRELVALSFRILSDDEWLQQLKVERIDLVTETADGQIRVETGGALRWGTHLAFRPSVCIKTVVPAPNRLLKGSARLADGENVLRNEEFSFRLTQTSQRVWLDRLDLLQLGAPPKAKHLRLNLAVQLEDQLKITRPIIILPSECLTNFEGQLSCNSKDLSLDEEAYEEILAQVISNPVPRRKMLL